MFLKKLNFTPGETNLLAIATGILIIGILAVISLMQPTLTQKTTDIRFLGYQFTRLETTVLAAARIDEEPFVIPITEENENEIYSIENIIRNTFAIWQRLLRNSIIFLYILFLYLLMMKKKENHFQGVFKGILVGSGFMLLLFTMQLGLDVSSGLVKFGHDFIHLVPMI